MIAIYKKIKTLSKVFGFKFSYLLVPLVYGLYKIILHLFFGIDYVFFHLNIKRTKIVKPIFLIGHPRSGTTFIHRFILSNNLQLKGNQLWEMIYSAISLRKILKPFLPKMNAIFLKRNGYNAAIHETGLIHAETDDAAIMFRYFDGLLPFLYFDAWKKYKSDDELIQALNQHVGTKKHQKYLTRFYKRGLNNTNKRIFSKTFSGILYIDELINNYTDSKILIIIRNREEVIPSSLSLVKSMLSNFIDFKKIDEQKKQIFYKNILVVSKYYYSRLNEIIRNEKYKSFVFPINYIDLKSNFVTTMTRIYKFCELELNDSALKEIETQAEKQKHHKSKHVYSLEEFGLSNDLLY
ncbi:MAG TPA: hypothetical protein DDX39_00415 [Bacteroidales bacterium]|nr:MAG: hypothetical protein A2W98_03140 [Bacteroidetes bacterium GWF2_33_38]OFY69822.1 MAG: hypothetical protein A2265_06115 [Bacteroidetes bacterium RIFOXYA12_FULL_33_9]OFY91879.1 MAG: hypothetical protein A2236_04860 [Bacteroidetes bacterium RIFOXYA2_FULL_33_7]HBF87073.1 hypothetical protein [Bacteroidales bacterium]